MSLFDDTLYTVPIFNDIRCVVDDTYTDLFSNKIMVFLVKIIQNYPNFAQNEYGPRWTIRKGVCERS